MDQPRSTDTSEPARESFGERLGKGLAVDLIFGLVLLVAFVAVNDFGLAFLVALAVIVGGYVLIRHFLTRERDEPPKV